MKNLTKMFWFMYDISYRTLLGGKSLCIRFDIGGFIKVYDGTRYLTLFGSEKNDSIYNRTRYVIEVKNGIILVFSHYYAKTEVDSYDLF